MNRTPSASKDEIYEENDSPLDDSKHIEPLVVTNINIPDEDLLFYRISKVDLKDGKIIPGAFKEQGTGEARGMSTDWCKYSSPMECLIRPTPNFPDGKKRLDTHGVVSLMAGKVRAINPLKVYYDPIPSNNAHSHVCGIPANDASDPTKTRVRTELRDIANWEINVSQ